METHILHGLCVLYPVSPAGPVWEEFGKALATPMEGLWLWVLAALSREAEVTSSSCLCIQASVYIHPGQREGHEWPDEQDGAAHAGAGVFSVLNPDRQAH